MSEAGKGSGAPGFTLLEMLVVLAVTALIAGLAFPSLERMTARQRLEEATRTIELSMRQARAQAIERARPVRFAVASDGRTAVDGVVAPRALPAAVRVTGANGGVTFFADGTSSGGDTRIASGAGVRIIQVAPGSSLIAVRR